MTVLCWIDDVIYMFLSLILSSLLFYYIENIYVHIKII